MLRSYKTTRPAYGPGGVMEMRDLVVFAHGMPDAARKFRQVVDERAEKWKPSNASVLDDVRLLKDKRKRNRRPTAKVAA